MGELKATLSCAWSTIRWKRQSPGTLLFEIAGGEGLHSAEGIYLADYCQTGGGGGEWGEIYLIGEEVEEIPLRRRRRRSHSASGSTL